MIRSIEFRQKVVDYIKAGNQKTKARDEFGVTFDTINKWLKRAEKGSLDNAWSKRHSIEFRKKVLAYIKNGKRICDAIDEFGLSRTAIDNWIRKEQAGTLLDLKRTKYYSKIDKKLLIATVKQHPEYSLSRFAKLFQVDQSTISKALKALKIIKTQISPNEKPIQYSWKLSPDTPDL